MSEIIYVPIIRTSIRYNPRAGDTQDLIPGNMTMEIHGKLTDKKLIDRMLKHEDLVDTKHMNVKVTQFGTEVSKKGAAYTFHAVVWSSMTSERTVKLLWQYFGKEIHYTINYNPQLVHFMTPEPTYLYNHKRVHFECPACGQPQLTSDRLVKRVEYDGDGDECGDSLHCPKCDVEIEFHYERMVDTDLTMYADQYKERHKRRKHA